MQRIETGHPGEKKVGPGYEADVVLINWMERKFLSTGKGVPILGQQRTHYILDRKDQDWT